MQDSQQGHLWGKEVTYKRDMKRQFMTRLNVYLGNMVTVYRYTNVIVE